MEDLVGSGERRGNRIMADLKLIKNSKMDIKNVVAMSKEFHSEAMEPSPFNSNLVSMFLSKLCDDRRGIMIVCVDELGNRVGFLAAHCFPNYLTGELMAEETAIYVSPDWRRDGAGDLMLDEFERWAKEDVKAARLRVTAQASLRMAGVVRWFESRGYKQAEMSLTKEVTY